MTGDTPLGPSSYGIVTMMSGARSTLGSPGTNVSSVIQNSENRPDINGGISYRKPAATWFNPAVFSVPSETGNDISGSLGFNALRGPGRQNWNLSLFKSFVISEARGSRFEHVPTRSTHEITRSSRET